MITTNLSLPKLGGTEISPGIWLVGEPTPVPGTNFMRCLADVNGALCLVELSVKFGRSVHETAFVPNEGKK